MEINEKKGNKGLIIVIILLLAIIIGLLVFVILNKDKLKNNDSLTNNQNNVSGEKEVNLEDYKYLYENTQGYVIEGADGEKDQFDSYYMFFKFGEEGIENFLKSDFSFKDIDNSYFLDVAISQLEDDQFIEIKDDESSLYAKISADDVDKKIKELFGQNFSYKHESFKRTVGATYNQKENMYYLFNGFGISYFDFAIDTPIKATKNNNQINIYVAVGAVQDFSGEDDNVSYIKPQLYNSLDFTKKIDATYVYTTSGEDKIDNLSVDEYMKQNQDKFSQYKFTFTKENDNYIFTDVKKVK